jgi:hypothetical protein
MDRFCAQQGSVGDSFLVEGRGSSQCASVSVFAMPESWADVMHGRSPFMHMSTPEIALGGDSREQSRRPLLQSITRARESVRACFASGLVRRVTTLTTCVRRIPHTYPWRSPARNRSTGRGVPTTWARPTSVFATPSTPHVSFVRMESGVYPYTGARRPGRSTPAKPARCPRGPGSWRQLH